MYPNKEDLASLLPTEVGQETSFRINGKPYKARMEDPSIWQIAGVDRNLHMYRSGDLWDVRVERQLANHYGLLGITLAEIRDQQLAID